MVVPKRTESAQNWFNCRASHWHLHTGGGIPTRPASLPQTHGGGPAQSGRLRGLQGSDTSPGRGKEAKETTLLQMAKLLKKKTDLRAVASALT